MGLDEVYSQLQHRIPYPTFLFEYGLRIRRAKTEELEFHCVHTVIAETEHLWTVEVDTACLFLAGTVNFMPILSKVTPHF